MSSITQFPFPSDTAPESQVVEWLAEVIAPKSIEKAERIDRTQRNLSAVAFGMPAK